MAFINLVPLPWKSMPRALSTLANTKVNDVFLPYHKPVD